MYCLHFKIMSMQKVIFRVYAVSFGEGGFGSLYGFIFESLIHLYS